MNSIRLFLECNQIFFEVFYYVVVGIAGIIFSRYQYKSNKRQVEMHKMQIEMQNKESQPIFKIKYRIDSHKEKNDTEYMEIYNEGELFKSFNYKIETFYKLQYSSCENGINSIYYVPIYDYYCFGERTENLTTGKLVKKYLPENHAKFYKLYTEAIELSKNNNYIFINRFSLIKIEAPNVGKITTDKNAKPFLAILGTAISKPSQQTYAKTAQITSHRRYFD